MEECILIMAGGRGTRFWPLSTDDKPKQFLNLIGNKTMLQLTVSRLLDKYNLDNIFICTGEKYVAEVKNELPKLSEKNIIIEPVGRNTAPCILLSTLYISQIKNECTITVLPSDHMINESDKFLHILEIAAKYSSLNSNAIITLGIKPTRPETGYGYIKQANEKVNIEGYEVVKVNRFVEKPSHNVAVQYLKEGNYLWNAGMFVFNSNNMKNMFKQYYYNGYDILNSLPSINHEKYLEILKNVYHNCEAISVDYAIMEKCTELYVVPCEFGWDDIGSWNALERYIIADSKNNICKGDIKLYNANNNLCVATEKKVIFNHVSDLYCIETDDTIIIGRREEISNIKELKDKNE